ncbi:hypothetical protein [Clostridium felsineum]|uniref:Uncharacterized protein n=1 Tax=Clostridium felsineum TaxID=36839 RepID=A0A1S8LQN6_9CLOT|nr:hypothetical protein [Clostridium felsineum]URZ05473.1 hypothetical protein CLROS_007990 [Clostridium felsineum]URZ10513.1 hypothetical protein CROST_012230 [Clostridium felsineum]
MGCDISLFAEGFISKYPNEDKKWINIDHWYREDEWADIMVSEYKGFNYTDLIDGNRDYGLFYLLAGVRGSEDEKSYPPIAKTKGLPKQMDTLIKKYILDGIILEDLEGQNGEFHDASYLTLKELKDSDYARIKRLKGWVIEEEYIEAIEILNKGEQWQLSYVDIKCEDIFHEGMILKEWDGYINMNLIHMIERMEQLKKERHIEKDEEIRIVFWFDN